MPQNCKTCQHPEREAIDKLLLDGRPPLRVIGAQYGLSKDSLYRHWQFHVRDARPCEARQAAESAAPEESKPAPGDEGAQLSAQDRLTAEIDQLIERLRQR